MIKLKKRFNDSPGQALVEFALIISVLLMMIFLIIESARILWAWNTVQNAAREGVRYAITGQAEVPNCVVDFGLPKFVDGDRDVCEDLRVASIIERAHTKMAGLPLNEQSVTFEDDQYYNIEVWGVDQNGQLQYDFAGIPSNPVIVRVTYRVPIITPFFTPILPSIPVFGQETLNNETFGQLGGTGNEGAALPPDLPPVPTPGVTPSPTPTPTPSNTPTVGPSSTPTHTPTLTPTPRCDVRFEGAAVAGNNFVFITGDVGVNVTIINLTTGATLGSGTLGGPFDNHACLGFSAIILNPALTSGNVGHVLLAVQTGVADNNDATIVVGAPPTPTPSPTLTPVPTSTPTNTPTVAPTSTPTGPYILVAPNCGPGPNILFNVQGFNWPINQSVTLSWQGTPQIVLQANQHTGSFSFTWTFSGLGNGTYTVGARSGVNGATASAIFTIPCAGQPTPTPGATSTPLPPDLIAISPPTLISTPPIVAYQPVQFSVAITNTGDIAVENQFFVDIYLDPTNILTDRIPLAQSDGYSAVSSLAGGASRVITVTSPLGFTNNPTNHQVYGMVDSVLQIPESSEINNVTDPFPINYVTPGPTPTPTPGLTGDDEISGVVRALIGSWLLQFRATVVLIDETTSTIVASTQADANGFYTFNNVPSGSTYTVQSCIVIDGNTYYGLRTNRIPPDPYADIFAQSGGCP